MQTATDVQLKASELRVGNWVLSNGDYVRIESIHEKGLNVHAEPFYDMGIIEADLPFKTTHPILLTHEVLKKCGFEKDGNAYRKGLINVDSEMGVGIEPETYGQVLLVDHIKYLHQLQNLYYNIEGKELEVSL